MVHGLIWLPLLGVFIGLAWAGWNEYQKLEAYRRWAADYDRSKYDIYAVLGQKGETLTWGKPTRQGPINLQTIALSQVRSVQLRVDGQVIKPSDPPASGRTIVLEIEVLERSQPLAIPFTEITLAIDWYTHLQAQLPAN
ncbi:hypothetical protein OOK60_13760 [Trichothermofontia sichuanensis B231]|uniref:hypothetical protein n=1 Tax=Trichothermofontia sichuanensis TaxID=3045816 RepID=UPI0022471097|nr:hypothetical protein [Trichothermofontia sichuanensis]UZQ53556.1 hypothetical protein OOK60_13760 [Trichothermofontia sichuanensis B231]